MSERLVYWCGFWGASISSSALVAALIDGLEEPCCGIDPSTARGIVAFMALVLAWAAVAFAILVHRD